MLDLEQERRIKQEAYLINVKNSVNKMLSGEDQNQLL